jgi:hypothetical protein
MTTKSMTHEELCVLAHAIISAFRAESVPDQPLMFLKELKNRSQAGGRPIAGLKDCKDAVDEVLTEYYKFDEQYNSHVLKYSEAVDMSRVQEIYLLDDATYYIALQYKRLSLGDSKLLPEEHRWISEYRESDEYNYIAAELDSEAGD